MRLIIRPDFTEVSAWAAHHVARRILDFQPTAKKPFLLGLPTGSTPLGLYKALIDLNKAGKVSFRHVVTFNMDEYVGLPSDHAQSYRTFMFENFFDHIDIDPKNVHILNGNAPDLDAECAAYEEAMKA